MEVFRSNSAYSVQFIRFNGLVTRAKPRRKLQLLACLDEKTLNDRYCDSWRSPNLRFLHGRIFGKQATSFMLADPQHRLTSMSVLIYDFAWAAQPHNESTHVEQRTDRAKTFQWSGEFERLPVVQFLIKPRRYKRCQPSFLGTLINCVVAFDPRIPPYLEA
jgi:hypothetical protein